MNTEVIMAKVLVFIVFFYIVVDPEKDCFDWWLVTANQNTYYRDGAGDGGGVVVLLAFLEAQVLVFHNNSDIRLVALKTRPSCTSS